MVKKLLEVVVNYLYPALPTVKTDWLFLYALDSVVFAAVVSSPFPSRRLCHLRVPFTHVEV